MKTLFTRDSRTRLVMATQSQLRDAVVRWFNETCRDVAALREIATGVELLLEISPRRDGAARMEMRLAPYGRVDLGCGRAAYFEELEVGAEDIVRACDAVRSGALQEKLWLRRDRVVAYEAVLRIVGDVWRSSDSTTIVPRHWWSHVEVHTYKPYS